MISRSTLQFLITLVVVSAVPAIGCFGYYTLDSFGEAGNHWATWIILAYPLSLIGLVTMIATLFSPKRTTYRLLVSATIFILPAAFLIAIKF